jgi:hypothetical protein
MMMAYKILMTGADPPQHLSYEVDLRQSSTSRMPSSCVITSSMNTHSVGSVFKKLELESYTQSCNKYL